MRILEVNARPKFRLFLRFDDGVTGEVDLSDLAGKGVFAAWTESGMFDQVRISEIGAAEWPGEIDLCPDSLYIRLTGKSPGEVLPALRKSLTHA